MDLFGDKLKEIRQEKDFSLDQIARETKISRKYLEAIEENDFSVFPSETYLIGFLRTYTEFLGLDSTKYINQYRNYKIQEQPIPINELLDIKKRMHPVLIILLIVLGMVIVAAGSIFVYRYFFGNQESRMTQEPLPPSIPEDPVQEYYFKDEVSTNWFLAQDKIIIPQGETEYTLTISEIGEGITIQIGEDSAQLALAEEMVLNLDGDDNDDLKITLNKIEEGEKGLRVNLGLYKVTAAITSTMTTIIQDDVEAEAGEVAVSAGIDEESVDTSEEIVRDTTIIFEAEEADPFVLNIKFEGQCLFRYLQDNKNRYEKFFQNNDALDIDVSNQVKLWISNAGSVNARLSGKKIVFGKAGQVVTKILHWRKDTTTNKYKLELSSIY